MAVLTEAKLRELVGAGQKEVVLEKHTIVTPAARDFAIQVGVKLVFSSMGREKGTTFTEEIKESCPLTAKGKESVSCEGMPAVEEEQQDVLDKVSQLVKQKVGDNVLAEEVITKVLATLRERQKCLARSSLLGRTTGGPGILVTLPSGSQCSIALVELRKGAIWECPRDTLLLVGSGDLKVLPEGVHLTSGYGFHILAGCSLQALEDSMIFCIV